MTELETQIIEPIIFGYINNKGQKVFTPNLEFAHIMVSKNGSTTVYVERK